VEVVVLLVMVQLVDQVVVELGFQALEELEEQVIPLL
tara:strand:- start:395 stop:505 length:111 start_codon:yes stop_codon:yes gene_type:complete